MRETLRFSLRLRMRGISDPEQEKIVSMWISRMNLQKVADKRVGTPLKRGVSNFAEFFKIGRYQVVKEGG